MNRTAMRCSFLSILLTFFFVLGNRGTSYFLVRRNLERLFCTVALFDEQGSDDVTGFIGSAQCRHFGQVSPYGTCRSRAFEHPHAHHLYQLPKVLYRIFGDFRRKGLIAHRDKEDIYEKEGNCTYSNASLDMIASCAFSVTIQSSFGRYIHL